ncbi:hypothetical protein GO984_11025 [Rhodobacteraceae bacterium CY05]|uniref:Uncharacterized protein n=1 Tax=Parasedimentitalea huanghaiensis TaxID=2682100 RepID=A0A6L6WGA3_9RHOB|nr:hypothetical protein [Zongyanglinia huanghaiensis]
MIKNLIDHRKRPYRWKAVNAVVESTWHDNSCEDADKVAVGDEMVGLCEERRNISVAEAMTWGMSMKEEVTLYLYDQGQGI